MGSGTIHIYPFAEGFNIAQHSTVRSCFTFWYFLIFKKYCIKYHSSWCDVRSVYVPLNLYAEILTSNVMVLGSEALGKGHLGGALLSGISALIKGSPESSPTLFSALWGHKENSVVCNREVGHHQNPIMLAPWSQTPASINKTENKLLLFISHPVWYFVIAGSLKIITLRVPLQFGPRVSVSLVSPPVWLCQIVCSSFRRHIMSCDVIPIH